MIEKKKSKKFHIKERKSCSKCGSISIYYRKKTNDYVCYMCNNIFNTPIIVKKLHNKMGQCVEKCV